MSLTTAFRLTVQHVLSPTQTPPAPSVTPLVSRSAPPVKAAPKQAPTKPKAATSSKPPGLELLARLNKPGQVKSLPKEKQMM